MTCFKSNSDFYLSPSLHKIWLLNHYRFRNSQISGQPTKIRR